MALLGASRPLEAFRLLIADIIMQKMKNKNETVEVANVERQNDESDKVSYISGKKNTFAYWEKEQNNWNMIRFSDLKTGSVDAQNGIVSDFETEVIALHYGIPQTNNDHEMASLYAISFEKNRGYFLSYYMLYGGKEKYKEISTAVDADTTTASCNFFGLEVGVGLQLPIRLSKLYLIPYVKVPFSITYSTNEEGLFGGGYTGCSGGINLGFPVSSKVILFVGSEYVWRYPVFNIVKEGLNPYSYVGLNFGIHF